jgi:hypothetical protein
MYSETQLAIEFDFSVFVSGFICILENKSDISGESNGIR